MNQDPYVTFINAKGNAFSVVVAWLGSLFGPIYIFLGWGKYDEWYLYVGIGLSIYVLYSIRNGIKSLDNGVRSDFIIYSVIPVLLPIITVIGAMYYYA